MQAFLRNPVPTWQAFMDEMALRFQEEMRADPFHSRARDIALPFFERAHANLFPVGPEQWRARDWFRQRWIWVRNGRPGPEPVQPVLVPPAPVPQAGLQPRVNPGDNLGRLAADAQNVHTTVVTKQTNDAVEKLLGITVPSTQQTERQMTVAWLSMPNPPGFNEYLRVANDVNRWFLTNTCRTENDNLYRKLLRGLVALIERQEGETRVEIFKRLWEECREAAGMCCEGHISRLCNVMVGFDESFKPPVPFGEVLQSKMSAIAMSDASDEEKIRQATLFFDEFAVPPAERVAWLEAF